MAQQVFIQQSSLFTNSDGRIEAAAAASVGRIHSRKRFVSRRIPLGYESEKPWLKQKARGEILSSYIIYVAFAIGLIITGILTWVGTTEVTSIDYCLVLDEDFSEGLDSNVWFRDVQIGGFGNGLFDWTTDSDENAYVKDGHLYIVPTFITDAIGESNMLNGYSVNLTADGTCTSSDVTQCAIHSNSSINLIIPPIRSARLTTKFSANVKYGKLEVRAKFPAGDWLWPAIWMLPTNDTYGVWPASGEIDIAESRGNNHSYTDGGNNVMSSSLHWGPTSSQDMYYKTTNRNTLKRTTFAQTYHTFGVEWNDKYVMTYFDGKLRQVFHHKFQTPFWHLGDFKSTYDNGTTIANTWPASNSIAPFDQEFYLILNVAAGGTNGFFQDNVGDKPWINGDRQTAMKAFWDARSEWESTGVMIPSGG